MSTTAKKQEGRVAVVTGANKGIGYFTALQLGNSGLFQHIVIGCRDASRGQAAVEQLQSQITNPNTTVSCVPFELGNPKIHTSFCQHMEREFGKVDVLVNNAAIAFKNSDPTPFHKQTKPVLDTNFRGTVDFTEELLPLLRKGTDPRLVNVASQLGRLNQVSTELQAKFSASDLTLSALRGLVDQFETDVVSSSGTQHQQKGWGNSNYGFSKLALIAATKVWAREEPGIKVNCCCPGYCNTDMTSGMGPRDPAEGAKNAVIPATMENPPTGEFFSNYAIGKW